MKDPWLPPGSSDPISYTCTCACSRSNSTSNPDDPDPSKPGLVLLFYRYFASPPLLPSITPSFPSPSPSSSLSTSLSTFHTTLTCTLSLSGKIRVGPEGFNITVGGTTPAITAYMEACLGHWSFDGLRESLGSEEARRAFFKPTRGCGCVFDGGPASVRVVEEITPMGVTNYRPQAWEIVTELSPAAFHARCLSQEVILIDLRNHYESRIGYFVSGSGEPAIRPPVRRFAQWPLWVRRVLPTVAGFDSQSNPDPRCHPHPEDHYDLVVRREEEIAKPPPKQYITYCTGGIRCEKGSRFLAENLPNPYPDPNPLEIDPERDRDRVFTLKGGISAYLIWLSACIAQGTLRAEDSLFKGRNFVFDARGSMALGDAVTNSDRNTVTNVPIVDVSTKEEVQGVEKVAHCHGCHEPEDRLGKCSRAGCHLILVLCAACAEGGVKCCAGCGGDEVDERNRGSMCDCERERELALWGPESESLKRAAKGGRSVRKMGKVGRDFHGNGLSVDIRYKSID